MDKTDLLTDLLREVSRTFYLTLRMLPAGLREPVSLAYLLARAADTIADTRALPSGIRLKQLLAFRAQVENAASFQGVPEIEPAMTEGQARPEERRLLRALPSIFSVLNAMPPDDQKQVRWVVVMLTRGMEMDLTHFPSEEAGRIAALKSPEELDRYLYLVAGCVGEFWTRISRAHLPPLRHWDIDRMSEMGVRFGKALQLTNILRDLPRDLRIGRCYLPATELAQLGMVPEDLLDPERSVPLRPLWVRLIEITLDHYRTAEDYLLAVPRRCPRMRLALLWPILIGLGTLARLAWSPCRLDPSKPVKVGRGWVYRRVALSWIPVWGNRLLRTWIGSLRKRVNEGLSV